MQFREKLILFFVCLSFVLFSHSAEQKLSAEFWQWYLTYADEDGEVFDPLALQELMAMTATLNAQDSSEGNSQDNSQSDQSSAQSTEQQQESKSEQQSTSKQAILTEKKDNKESTVSAQELAQP